MSTAVGRARLHRSTCGVAAGLCHDVEVRVGVYMQWGSIMPVDSPGVAHMMNGHRLKMLKIVVFTSQYKLQITMIVDMSCTQATMVGTWLLELYLDQLNRSLLEVKGQPPVAGSNGHVQGAGAGPEGSSKALPAPDQLTQDLRAFLKRNVDVLDVNVTISLLAGYGRLDDLMEYATYRKVRAGELDY